MHSPGGEPSAFTESANACVDAFASLTTASNEPLPRFPPFSVEVIDCSEPR